MAERTLVARWKGVADPSVKAAADSTAEAAEKSATRTATAWDKVAGAVQKGFAGAVSVDGLEAAAEKIDGVGGELGRMGAGLTGVGDRLAEMNPEWAGFGAGLSEAGKNLTLVNDALDIGVGALNLTKGAVSALSNSTKVQAAVSKAAAAAQWLINAAMSANPIGIVVVAVAALVAGLVIAYNKSETFRKIVDGAFQAVGKAGTWLWQNALAPAFAGIVDGFAWIVDGVAWLLDAWGNLPGQGWAKDAAAGLRKVAGDARGAAAGLRNIPSPKVNTGPSVNAVDKLNSRIRSLKGKVVEARAKGDTSGVDRLKEKIRNLEGKTVTVSVRIVGKSVKIGAVAGARIGLLNADGAIYRTVRRFAGGGFENHRAQIAPAGAWRVWAEPETGGESYIPLSPAKRAASRAIWWETGRRLGVVPYGDGGVNGGDVAVASDTVADLLRQMLRSSITRDDLARLIAALRETDGRPRRLAGVTL